MPRQKRTRATKGPVVAVETAVKTPAEPVAEPVAEPAMGPVEDLGYAPASMFDNMDDDAYVIVSWLNPDTKTYEAQGRLEPGDDNEIKVQELCGGGKYMCREMARDPETGRMGYKRQRTMTIGGDHFTPKVKKPVDASKPELGTREIPEVANLTEAISGQIITLLNQGQAMTATQVDGMRALMEMMAKQKPSEDTGFKEMMLAMMTQNTALMQAIVSNKPVEPPPQPDPIGMIEKIGGVLKATSPSSTGLKEALEAVTAIISLKRDVDDIGAIAPETQGWALAAKYIPEFFKLAKEEKDEKKFTERAMAMLPASTDMTQGKPEPQPQPESEGPMWRQILLARKTYLMNIASLGADPEIMADAEFQQMPSAAKGLMGEWLANDNAFEMAMQVLPELKREYPQWSERFFQRLHMNFYPELYEEPDGAIEEGSERVEGLGAREPGEEEGEKESGAIAPNTSPDVGGGTPSESGEPASK